MDASLLPTSHGHSFHRRIVFWFWSCIFFPSALSIVTAAMTSNTTSAWEAARQTPQSFRHEFRFLGDGSIEGRIVICGGFIFCTRLDINSTAEEVGDMLLHR